MQKLQRIASVLATLLALAFAVGGADAATPAGAVTEFSSGITPGAGLGGVTAGPDGNLWFTETSGDRVGFVTTAGAVTEFATGITAGAHPTAIAVGADGNL